MAASQGDLFAGRMAAASPGRTAVHKPVERFDGGSYDPRLDRERLSTQLECVRYLLSDNRWWALPELTASVRKVMGKTVSDSSITARIRDLRKPRFGSHTIERRRRQSGGTWEYRLVHEEENR